MIHQPPRPRIDNAKTPNTQNASIQPIKVGSAFTICGPVATVCDGAATPGATVRGKSPETRALATAEDVAVKTECDAVERICHANVRTAAASIAMSEDKARIKRV